MSNLDINQTLVQMRILRDQAQSKALPPDNNTVDFGSLLKASIDQVNSLQQNANNLADAFEKGDTEINLSEVMIASKKASLSFQATLQVRNKLVEAYKDRLAF